MTKGSAVPRYQQVFLPSDEVAAIGTWRSREGWPIGWRDVPDTPLAYFKADPDDLAERLGISFAQSVSLGDGLGDRPRAILELPSGLCFALACYPLRGYLPYWHDICVDVDPHSVNRPFLDGVWGEAIVERYRDDLILEIFTALQLPLPPMEWRQPPRRNPPLTTREGWECFVRDFQQVPPPRFDRGASVRVRQGRSTVVHLLGKEGAVVDRLIRTRPVQQEDGWREGAEQWEYLVVIPDTGRLWLLRDEELEIENKD